MNSLPWLDSSIIQFPDTRAALTEPNGLLAAGGALNNEWLLQAYSQGIFPWFSEGDPILWWSPSPRTVINVGELHISRSLHKAVKKNRYTITFDTAFTEVVEACAEPRGEDEHGTWITPDIVDAYTQLHLSGHAHSVEVWDSEQLVGGLYGIALGRVFFGESMFSFQTNCSKIALYHLEKQLKQWHYVAIDCQVHNDHLASLGAIKVSRDDFEQLLEEHVHGIPSHWLHST